MAVEYIGNGAPDGVSIGLSTTEKVSMYGVTPVVQRSGADQAAVSSLSGSVATTGSSTTSPAGYTTTSQADGIVENVNSLITNQNAIGVLVNEIRTALVNFGIIKGSA